MDAMDSGGGSDEIEGQASEPGRASNLNGAPFKIDWDKPRKIGMSEEIVSVRFCKNTYQPDSGRVSVQLKRGLS